MNLRSRTGEERRRQTLCDKRDNNFVSKKLFAKLHLSLNMVKLFQLVKKSFGKNRVDFEDLENGQ